MVGGGEGVKFTAVWYLNSGLLRPACYCFLLRSPTSLLRALCPGFGAALSGRDRAVCSCSTSQDQKPLPLRCHLTAGRSDAPRPVVHAPVAPGQALADGLFACLFRRLQPKSWDTAGQKHVAPSGAAQHRHQVPPT